MTLKTMINEVQDIVGLPAASSIVSNTEIEVRQLLALANREGRELKRRYPWEILRKEQTFTSTATETQATAIPSDFDHFVNETMYNRSQTRRVVGPLTVGEWQAQKGLTVSILTDAFMIRGGAWLATPTPEAGDTYAFSYVSKNWCQDSSSTGQAAWAADDDTGILDETLMGQGVQWRWLQTQGLDYAEAYRTYQFEVSQAILIDGAKRTFQMGADDSLLNDARAPVVPDGGWSL